MATADVRALLRAERASRRITHPHASYTTDGKLLCNLCDTLVKSEAQWQNHLHSTRHRERSQAAGKKRKAESPPVEDQVEDESERNRSRPDDGENERENGNRETHARPTKAVKIQDEPDVIEDEAATVAEQDITPAPLPTEEVDEAEMAAFEREMAAMEESEAAAPSALSALTAEATISAEPMTAEQLAAQAREEQSAQRGRRDVELEAEKEDATRVLEEELEEMEGLEARVRRLRERREALRDAGTGDQGGGSDGVGEAEVELNGAAEDDGNSSEDDDEDEEDFDEWRFGGS